MFSKIIDTIWEHIGAQCLICREPGHSNNICKICRDQLPRNNPACYYCANPVSATVCGQCILVQPSYRLIAPFRYDNPLDKLVYQLKFNASLAHAKLFGEILSCELEEYYHQHILPEVIIPIPLSKNRLRERGFNQCLEIARVLARHYSLPIDSQVCQRKRHTNAQARLAFKARKENIRQAFHVEKNNYRYVVLLDDVVTTGSTINEVANSCIRSGIEKVDVWSVTRAFQH